MKADLKRSLFLLSALLCGMAVTAAATNAQAQEFHRWAESARGLGMGGALTAVATGSDAMLYNPAGLIQQQFWKVELSGSTDKSDSDPDGFFSTFDGFPGSVEEVDAFLVESEESRYLREQLFASFHNGSGLGFGVIDITTRQAQSAPGGVHYREERFTAVNMTLAWATDVRLIMWGITFRSMGRELIDEDFTSNELLDPEFDLDDFRSEGNALAYDLGLIFRLPIPFIRPTIAVAQLNGNDPDFGFKKRPGLTGEVNAAIAINPDLFGQDMDLVITAELRDASNTAFESEKRTGKLDHFGAEFSIWPLDNGIWGLQLRGGSSQGYISLGAGVNLAHYISVSAARYTEELGTSDNPQPEERTILEVKIGF